MAHVIEPGSLIGVLGGGQLGAMFAHAAKRLGYRVAVWDPDPDAPAHAVADRAVRAPFEAASALDDFRRDLAAATYEWENVPEAVVATLESAIRIRPAAAVLRTIQHRVRQKQFLLDHGLPTPRFTAVARTAAWRDAGGAVGYPCLCKTATSGYDGKGQWVFKSAADVESIGRQQEGHAEQECIIEEFVPFEKELSVLVVRADGGEHRTYPVAENLHDGGILRISHVPAAVDREVAEQARRLATSTVAALEGVGVFCVELFLRKDGRLLINEVAPRPHNSGHYTLDACTVSQFEQQVRVLCGLPLGEVRLLSCATMVNLIGEDLNRATANHALVGLLKTAGAALHLYGKRVVRPRRKMGHVTFLAEKADEARDAAERFVERLHASR